MFTSTQIHAAHGKVRSGADFPVYIREIRSLGVTHYEAYVSDGRMDYHGADGHTVSMPARFEPLAIADQANLEAFQAGLLAHQQGETDFPTFLGMCAATVRAMPQPRSIT